MDANKWITVLYLWGQNMYKLKLREASEADETGSDANRVRLITLLSLTWPPPVTTITGTSQYIHLFWIKWLSNYPTVVTTRLTYNCAHLRSTKKSLTFEYSDKENIFFGKGEKKREGKRGKYMENEDIFLAEKKNGEGKYISCGGIEKQMEKTENIWRRKIFFAGGTINGGGKGG